MRTRLCLWGFIILVLNSPTAQGTAITILDQSETLSFLIDGNLCLAIGTPGAPCTTGGFGSGADITFSGDRVVTRIFTSFLQGGDAGRFGFILYEAQLQPPFTISGVSDIVMANVTDIGFGFRQTFFTFVSDPLTAADLADPLVKGIMGSLAPMDLETGSPIPLGGPLGLSFRDATGVARNIPGDLSIVFVSDVDVPEPSSFHLLACFIVLFGMRRIAVKR